MRKLSWVYDDLGCLQTGEYDVLDSNLVKAFSKKDRKVVDTCFEYFP